MARPLGVTTVMADVVTQRGANAMSFSEENNLKVDVVAPKSTAEAAWKFLPATSTREPSGPLVGEMLTI